MSVAPYSMQTNTRNILLWPLRAPLPALACPCVTMLPAFDAAEVQTAYELATQIHAQGGTEFCCVGPYSEQLHDSLDAYLEAHHAFDVVTTWHQDALDACEYFLFATGEASTIRLALIAGHPLLVDTLHRVDASEPLPASS